MGPTGWRTPRYFVSLTMPTIRFSSSGSDGVASRQKRSSDRVRAEAQLFGECFIDYSDVWGLAGVAVIEIASGGEGNSQGGEVVGADAAEVRPLALC